MSTKKSSTPAEVRQRGSESLARVAQQLDAEIAELERTIGTLNITLAQLRAARKQIKGQAPAVDGRGNASGGQQAVNAGGGKIRRHRANSDGQLIVDFAASAIQEAGRPMDRKEIYDRMIDAGIHLRSKHPLKRIGKALWVADEFTHAGKGYWLAGVPLPRNVATKKATSRRALAA